MSWGQKSSLATIEVKMGQWIQCWLRKIINNQEVTRWDFKRSGNCLFPWLLMTWHVVHELSIHFCMILKKFSCPFHCHLMSVHLPRRCHFADPSQIANLKTTPLLDKLHIIVKFPIIQLQDADISAVTARAPDIMHFFVIRDRCPPPAAAGRRTDGCALEFFTRASSQGSRDHVTWPAKSPRMLMCVNSPGDGYESAIECEHSFF